MVCLGIDLMLDRLRRSRIFAVANEIPKYAYSFFKGSVFFELQP